MTQVEPAPAPLMPGGKEGVHVAWNKVCYDVKEDKKDKRILHEVTGSVAPGEMLAIMGPSGCGKSSLLNILGRRRTEEDGASGDVLINGGAVPDSFSRLSGFVTQDFQFFEFLTVKETLSISARLTLPKDVPKKEKLQRVDELLKELDLTGAADTMIGSPTNPDQGGISGGERRRLCIAMELMNNPPLLFLDEPTSGLDAASALMVVELLKRQATAGKTVVCVIHQPRASILPLFNHVLLMASGKTVYYGPSCDFSGETDPLRSFFAEAGRPCPAFENPADHILDIINTTETAKGEGEEEALAKREENVTALCAHFDKSPLRAELDARNSPVRPRSPCPLRPSDLDPVSLKLTRPSDLDLPVDLNAYST